MLQEAIRVCQAYKAYLNASLASNWAREDVPDRFRRSDQFLQIARSIHSFAMFALEPIDPL